MIEGQGANAHPGLLLQRRNFWARVPDGGYYYPVHTGHATERAHFERACVANETGLGLYAVK